MNGLVKTAPKVILLLVVGMPVTFILTIVLSPFWSWIESSFGIESTGHSGPSDWCFELVYALYALAAVAVAWVEYRKTVKSV